MTKIESPLYRATVAETCDLSGNVTKVIAAKAIDDTYLNTTNSQLSAKSNNMAESISKDRKKEMTEQIFASDYRRNGSTRL